MTKINPKNTIEIVRMYTQEKLSSLKIAKIIGVSKYTILRCLMNNEIKRRSNSESNKGRIGNRRINLTPEQQEEAIRLYSKEFLSTNEIHKKYNLPERPIIRLLKEKGLFKGYNNRMRQLRENGKVNYNLRISTEEQKKDIINRYLNNLENCNSISKDYNCEQGTIKKLLKDSGVIFSAGERRKVLFNSGKIHAWNKDLTVDTDERVRKSIEKHKLWQKENVLGKHYEEMYGVERAKNIKERKNKKLSVMRKGEGNPMFGKKLELSANWQGGLSFEPYGVEFNSILKRQIRERDNNECILCRIGKEYKKESIGNSNLLLWQKICKISALEVKDKRKLSCHHIDYCKTNNHQSNLISLCFQHHLITNGSRDKFQVILQQIMHEKYGFDYVDNTIKQLSNLI